VPFKVNNIPDWTQAQLNTVINGGAPPPLPANTVLNDIVLPSDWNSIPTYYPTWDGAFLVDGTKYAGFNSAGDFLLYNTSAKPYAWFNSSDSRLYLAHPTRLKNTVTGTAASIYMATDSNNSATDAMYINAGGGGRLFMTAGYAINLNGVPRFENFVPEVAMRSSTSTQQGDGSTSTSYFGVGGNLIIYNGNFTGEITTSLAAASMRSFCWAVYAKSSDGFVREAGWTIRHGATAAEWTNPQFRLKNSSGTVLDVMMTGEHRIGLNDATAIGIRVRGAAAQTASLQEWQSSAGTLYTKIDATGNLVFSANNISTDTTTGTKIGTATGQKLGLWNVTPIIQPASANQAAVTTTVDTTAATNVVPYGYTTQAQADDLIIEVGQLKVLVNQLRSDLVAFGAIKGSA